MRIRFVCKKSIQGIGGVVILALFLLPRTARAETGEAYNWIGQLGQIAFTQGGAASLPGYVISSMRGGSISPIMQFVLVNSLMNKCIKDTYSFYPRRRDPYQLASAKFQYGMCRINKCFQQAMLLLVLPQLSGRTQYGGQPAQQSGGQIGAALAQSFQQQNGCGNNGNDKGISAQLLQAFGVK